MKPLTLKLKHELATLALDWTTRQHSLDDIHNESIVAALTLQDRRGYDGIAALRTIRNGLRLAGNTPAVARLNDIIHDALWSDDEDEPMWTGETNHDRQTQVYD